MRLSFYQLKAYSHRMHGFRKKEGFFSRGGSTVARFYLTNSKLRE